ncbi:Structural maintenance of chromosomes protein 1 [Tulasnella sp. 419]|nr:Structural maintenance of chromosomes protein 1 [Tulasnella sp. 419]
MPIIRLEVCDFKSYRGHQVIGPFKNFTSIMGPNGSGKSNLMDAISFVLGVKSAQLRSSQLKDLVYRGRRLANDNDENAEDDDEEGDGEGTAKKAWVMAVYLDQDGNEYHFQRTISTTGGSEYRINSRVVSYQSYNETLEQQNILVKAKNFLVFQGDVEAVASQSPKDLTRLIEQISGSLELADRYEESKAAQDRATENATFHFAKRRGIAGEIKQFREQKSEAERFEELIARRDSLVVHRLLWKLYHIEEAIENNARDIRSKNKELVQLRSEQAVHDSKVAAARSAQASARGEVQKKERVIKKKEKALELKQPDLVQADAQIAHSRRKIDKNNETIVSVTKDAEKQKEDLDRLNRQLEEIQAAASAAEEAQRKLAEQQGLSFSEEHLEEYHSLKMKAHTEAVDERQQVETLKREERTTLRAIESQRDKLEQSRARKDKLVEDSSTQGTRKDECEAKVTELQAQLAQAKQELENSQAERTRITQLETELNEKLQKLHDQLRDATQDSHETAKEARFKETLATLQRLFPGIRGRVVDLCKPTQRKYETAVSVILGRNIDAIVVDHEKTGIDCIEYLRNQRLGQATFIPLDTIKVKPINDKFRSFAKGARLAVDVIQFDPAVERAMHHACGNALVCDTTEVAKYICYEKQQEVKAVTLEGTVIHKGGNITGGRSSHSSKKWEDKEVAEMRRNQNTLANQLRELTQSKPRNKNDENLINEISRLESALALAKDDLSAAKLRLTGVKEELKHLQKEINKQTPELQKNEAELTRARQRVSELEEVVDGADEKIFASFCRKVKVKNIREFEERRLKAAQEGNDARIRFQGQIARLNHQTTFQAEQLKATQERLETLKALISKEQKNLKKLEASKREIQAEIDKAEEEIANLREQYQELNDALEEKTKELEEVKKTAGRSGKVLEKALKDIALKVR